MASAYFIQYLYSVWFVHSTSNCFPIFQWITHRFYSPFVNSLRCSRSTDWMCVCVCGGGIGIYIYMCVCNVHSFRHQMFDAADNSLLEDNVNITKCNSEVFREATKFFLHVWIVDRNKHINTWRKNLAKSGNITRPESNKSFEKCSCLRQRSILSWK